MVTYSHLMLLASQVLRCALNRSVCLERLDLSIDGIEPLLKIEVRLGSQDEWPRLIFDLKDVVAGISVLDVARKLLDCSCR